MNHLKFSYNCVYPENNKELKYIIDNMKEIKSTTFLNKVGLSEMNKSLMYGINYKTKKSFTADFCITCYKVKINNVDAYILYNSGIEYIFKSN